VPSVLLVLVDNPFTGETDSWANKKGFTKLQSYEWYKYVATFRYVELYVAYAISC
jgi:hypothetical protein